MKHHVLVEFRKHSVLRHVQASDVSVACVQFIQRYQEASFELVCRLVLLRVTPVMAVTQRDCVIACQDVSNAHHACDAVTYEAQYVAVPSPWNLVSLTLLQGMWCRFEI